MYRIRANRIVNDIRSGMSDDELMKEYKLSLKSLQRLMKMLVREQAIDHEELYERSPAYKSIADLLASRHYRRVYVPMAFRIYCDATSQTGFVRDISENGVRVAGIKASIGDEMTLRLPLKELVTAEPIEFGAICRWAKTAGRSNKYVVSGFEITDISDEARSGLMELVEMFRSENQGEERRLYTPLNVGELMETAQEMRAKTESREFSGMVDGVDILDFVQFMLLAGKKTLLDIQSSEGDECQLHLEDGRIVHAHHGEVDGKEAFFECMNLPGGGFSTQPWSEPDQRTVDELGEFLLVEAARRRDESSGDGGLTEE